MLAPADLAIAPPLVGADVVVRLPGRPLRCGPRGPPDVWPRRSTRGCPSASTAGTRRSAAAHRGRPLSTAGRSRGTQRAWLASTRVHEPSAFARSSAARPGSSSDPRRSGARPSLLHRRPPALGTPRREPQLVALGVDRVALAVDPPPKQRVSSTTSSVVADEMELSFFAITTQTPGGRAWLRCSHLLHDARSQGRTSGGSFVPTAGATSRHGPVFPWIQMGHPVAVSSGPDGTPEGSDVRRRCT